MSEDDVLNQAKEVAARKEITDAYGSVAEAVASYYRSLLNEGMERFDALHVVTEFQRLLWERASEQNDRKELPDV